MKRILSAVLLVVIQFFTNSCSEVKLGPPPTLPPLPNTQWSEKTKTKIDLVMKNYSSDQVSPYLTFREMVNDKKENLNSEQKKWLEDAKSNLKPRAIDVLNWDIKIARSSKDLRGAYIALLTLEHVEENDEDLAATDATLPKLKDLVKELLQENSASVWEIKGATGEFLSSFTDGFYPSEIKISPAKEGQRILQVKAQVKNASATSDPRYIPWSLAPARRIMLIDNKDEKTKPYRLAGDTFIYATTHDNAQLFPCSYVTKKSSALRYGDISVIFDVLGSSGGADNTWKVTQKVFPGSFIEQGGEFDLDVLFSVPGEVTDLRLLIIGSLPVPIQIQNK